jgi:hypothetical protein
MLRKALLLSMPVAVIVFCWTTVKTVAAIPGETGVFYGFPFAWYAPSAAGSLAFNIAIFALLVDFFVYLAVVYAFVLALRVRSISKLWTTSAWFAAVISIVVLTVAIGSNVRFVPWKLDDYFGPEAVRSRTLQFGPGAWR